MLYTPPTPPFSSYSCVYGTLIPGGDEIFRTRPDGPWGPPSLLHNGYRVSFPGVKRPGRGVDPAPPSSAEVKNETTAMPVLPLCAFMAYCGVNFTFTFT